MSNSTLITHQSWLLELRFVISLTMFQKNFFSYLHTISSYHSPLLTLLDKWYVNSEMNWLFLFIRILKKYGIFPRGLADTGFTSRCVDWNPGTGFGWRGGGIYCFDFPSSFSYDGNNLSVEPIHVAGWWLGRNWGGGCSW